MSRVKPIFHTEEDIKLMINLYIESKSIGGKLWKIL